MTTETPQQNIDSPRPKTLAVGIQHRPVGKIYTFITTDPSYKIGNHVVCETESGTTIGLVATPPKEADEEKLPQNARKILRKATPEELERAVKSREKAIDYFHLCQKKIEEMKLDMKLVDVEIEEGEKKAAFIFFAEQRVDFRALVKDLATNLHMRIEMRQIGARDEAKIKGCLSSCGRVTCCSQHLRQFQSISIAMAKHQGLAPNPTKLTGMCGKLRCCLAYEHAAYEELRKDLPKIGAAVATPTGAGKVTAHNVLKCECAVRLYNGGETRCPAAKLRLLTQPEREAAITEARRHEEANEEKARQRAKRFESRNLREKEKKQEKQERQEKIEKQENIENKEKK